MLFSTVLQANTFKFQATSQRFELTITQNSLNYRSERLNENISGNSCKQKHFARINSWLLSLMAGSEAKSGLPFIVDTHPLSIKPNSTLGKVLVNMDEKMTLHLLEMRRQCL